MPKYYIKRHFAKWQVSFRKDISEHTADIIKHATQNYGFLMGYTDIWTGAEFIQHISNYLTPSPRREAIIQAIMEAMPTEPEEIGV